MAKTTRIAYVTIDTLGNTTDFGDLTVARKAFGSTNNDTRGVFMGGESGEHQREPLQRLQLFRQLREWEQWEQWEQWQR